MTTSSFCYRFRVRYYECDAQRVVFNARYADYFDLAMTEFLRAIGYDYRTLLERGLDHQVVKLTMEWQAAAHFDDVIDIRVRAARIGNTSFELDQEISNADTGEPLCRGHGVYVMMNAEPFEKMRVPDDLREALEAGAPGRMIDQSGRAG